MAFLKSAIRSADGSRLEISSNPSADRFQGLKFPLTRISVYLPVASNVCSQCIEIISTQYPLFHGLHLQFNENYMLTLHMTR